MKFSIKHSIRWSIFISIVTFVLACVFSVVSTFILQGVAWSIGMLVVFVLIAIGIVFDMMGLASAAAQEKPFHAMASEKVGGSRHAIYIVRNADRFSNFCNDVVGDVTGILSGAATTLVVLKLMVDVDSSLMNAIVSVVFAGAVSALTVGGKAMGKSFSIYYATNIILLVGKCFYFLEHRLKIKVFNMQKKSNNERREDKRAAGNHQ